MTSTVPAPMTSLAHAPRLSLEDAERLARDLYGMAGSATPLPSERDQNFLLRGADGGRFVLKVANAAELLQMLEAENLAMRRLADTQLSPSLVPTRDGQDIGRHGAHFVRLVTCLDGVPLGDAVRQSDALLHDLGRAVAVIDRALAGVDHPALHRAFHWDLATAPAVIAARLPLVRDAALAGLIQHVMAVHRETVAPRLASLRQRAIHGDANDYNVLVDRARPARHRHRRLRRHGGQPPVNDVAIAMAYAALGSRRSAGARPRRSRPATTRCIRSPRTRSRRCSA